MHQATTKEARVSLDDLIGAAVQGKMGATIGMVLPEGKAPARGQSASTFFDTDHSNGEERWVTCTHNFGKGSSRTLRVV